MGANEMRPTRTNRLTTHADAAQRAQRAWAARVAGATWDQAATAAGYRHKSSCIRGVQRYFDRLPDLEDTPERRRLWRARLEVLWRQTVVDASQQRPGAVRAGVAVAQRAAALDGLDAPTRLEVYSPTSQEIAAYISAFRARLQITDEREPDVVEVD
jgi:hypothetical protein